MTGQADPGLDAEPAEVGALAEHEPGAPVEWTPSERRTPFADLPAYAARHCIFRWNRRPRTPGGLPPPTFLSAGLNLRNPGLPDRLPNDSGHSHHSRRLFAGSTNEP